ncbi:hypothetical protein MNBD_ALPHA09-961 [hydrothermal vent metagenome]|uniref:Uncharacterized protein n=1 Tax=hydrothermal vent metagenome TaxID=652676 RepID=A0A3B0U509_9ZZZZ
MAPRRRRVSGHRPIPRTGRHLNRPSQMPTAALLPPPLRPPRAPRLLNPPVTRHRRPRFSPTGTIRRMPIWGPPPKPGRRATVRWTTCPPRSVPRWRPRRCGLIGHLRRQGARPVWGHLCAGTKRPAPEAPRRVRASDLSSRSFRDKTPRPGRMTPPRRPPALRSAARRMTFRPNFSQNYRRKTANRSGVRPAPFKRWNPGPLRRRRQAGSDALPKDPKK